VTPDASKEVDVASASTGGNRDDISFRGVEREAVVEEPLTYASDARLYRRPAEPLRSKPFAIIIGVLVMMDAKRLDHFRQWRNVQWEQYRIQ
jgi:hypothetical protein